MRIIGDPAVLRANYLRAAAGSSGQGRACASKAQADYLLLDNGADLGKLLRLHFIRRLMRGGN